MQRCLVRIACNEKAKNARQTEARVINAAHSSLRKMRSTEFRWTALFVHFNLTRPKTAERTAAKKASKKTSAEVMRDPENSWTVQIFLH